MNIAIHDPWLCKDLQLFGDDLKLTREGFMQIIHVMAGRLISRICIDNIKPAVPISAQP